MNFQAAANDPREINTQLTADLRHRNYFKKQTQGPCGERWICLTQQTMTRQGLGHTYLSPLLRAALAACLYLPHLDRLSFFTINPELLPSVVLLASV